MDARATIGFALVLALLAGTARAQEPAPGADGSASTARMSLGGVAGGAAGLAGGFYLGAVLADDDDGDDLDALAGGVMGAAIGEALLLPLGVHLANRGRGSYGNAALTSAAIAVAGLFALAAVQVDTPGTAVVLVAVPVAQIAAAIGIERKTD